MRAKIDKNIDVSLSPMTVAAPRKSLQELFCENYM
jgi:hypothetical protein